jgi:hypothetical protein
MRLGVLISFWAILWASAASAGGGAAACARADFETVVDMAAGALRDMNGANKPKFQAKLRELKDKRGWSHEQFLKEAAPFVADDKITAYDAQSNALLEIIATGGEAGAAAATPDCAVLASLRASMKALVDAQTAKWGYMAGKIEAELAK